MFKILKLLSVVVIFFVVTGCVEKDWMGIDGKPYKFEKEAFYQEGKAGPKDAKDEPFREEVAGNRARAEMLKTFDAYLSYLMEDYKGTEGVNIERALKTFFAGHISGARIVAHRKEKGDIIVALCKLDLKSLKGTIELQQELSREARDCIKKNAETFFKKLEKEEEKGLE